MNEHQLDKELSQLLSDIDVRIIPFDAKLSNSRIRAYVEIKILDAVVIRGIKIIETKSGGLFIGYPSIRKQDGTFKDIVFIRNKSFESKLRKRILDCYHNWGLESDTHRRKQWK